MQCPCCEQELESKTWVCYEPGCGQFKGCDSCQVIHLMLIHEMPAEQVNQRIALHHQIERNFFPVQELSSESETRLEMYRAMGINGGRA
jgi:hypothetical protein